MSAQVVDIIDSFIAGLDYSLKIISAVWDSPTNVTTFTVNRMLFAREKVKVDVDSDIVPILEANYVAKTIKLQGDLTGAVSLKLVRPFFIHGTPYAVNQTLNKTKSQDKYPLIFLLEIIREQIPSEQDSMFSSIPTVRLFFLDERNKDWTTDQIYENVVNSQREYCNFVLDAMLKGKIFGRPSDIEIVSFAKFGEYIDLKGSLNSIFDAVLSGVELKLTLPIKKQCNCC
jgi:hypothetical protein